jgi:dienelactone hydrolase
MMRLLPTLLALAIAASGCGPAEQSTTITSPSQWLQNLPVAAAAGSQPVWTPSGKKISSTWYLTIGNEPVTITISGNPGTSSYQGSAIGADGNSVAIDNISWNSNTGTLGFRRSGVGFWQWIYARSVEGILVGRASTDPFTGDPPPDISALNDHVIGWSSEYFSRDILPCAFDLLIDQNTHARLRLDRDSMGMPFGRLKVYASEAEGSAAEEVEYDVTVQAWDGQNLQLTRTNPSWVQNYSLTVSGRQLVGTMTQAGDDALTMTVTGVREELLTFGLSARAPADRDDWQARVRRQLTHLMMADNPAPLSISVARTPTKISSTSDEDGYAPDRDDAPDTHPISYAVEELKITAALPNPYDKTQPLVRAIHGYLSTPMTPPPATGYPVVVALNGHDGSADGTFDPDDSMYWFADAWARRGFVVLSIDMSHRPPIDRGRLYGDFPNGDDPGRGNGAHPAIRSALLDSDWQEDGERVWDVLRGIDYLALQHNVDISRLMVTGLSMGAEVATFAGALDPRIKMVITAGFVPDLAVMSWHGNHACWQWTTSSPLDYFAVSDLHALIAPRPLIAESGTHDDEFSDLDPPFVAGKEVTRRSRTAYADVPSSFIFYLHDDQHAYHFGDVVAGSTDPPLYVTTPTITEPQSAGDLYWATDATTQSLGVTIVDQLLSALPAPTP